MAEPTRDVVLAALARAKELMKRNRDWDLMRALAEATTSATCGKESFKVFRDVRICVDAMVKPPLHQFAESTPRSGAIAAIDAAIESLRG